MDFWTTIGVIITVLAALRFISRLGNGLPILELMLFIAAAQWIMGPLIEYNLAKSTLQIFYVCRPTAVHELCSAGFWSFCNGRISRFGLVKNALL